MSRFAVNPKWLLYLPPTMSPCATSELPGYLEHPAQALAYYKKHGVETVVCEEKHMGSRVVLVVCRDEQTALRRFGISEEGLGVCYTRTGRNFFNDHALETEFLERVNRCLTLTQFWEKMETDWVCLDAELMPWSAKAQSLLQGQYAAVGAAAGTSLAAAEEVLDVAAKRGIVNIEPLLLKTQQRKDAVAKYVRAYRHYCWPVHSVEDYRLAPFHLLATEGKVHVDKNHQWHMKTLGELCQGDPVLFRQTPYKVVRVNDAESFESAVNWWLDLTKKGGEGMVVKPLDFIALENGQILQPAVKCRGSEYLRIIYGPEYDLPGNLERLRNRGLSRKQSLALREFALGVEAMERFVRKEPLRRIHESVFGVLALESEEVDPRL